MGEARKQHTSFVSSAPGAMLACCCKHTWVKSQVQFRSAFMVSSLVDAHNRSLGGVKSSGREHDAIRERFVKGRGPGGQKINKSRNCVQLTHQSTGVQVQVQDSRSLAANRGMARKRLKQKIKQHEIRQQQLQ